MKPPKWHQSSIVHEPRLPTWHRERVYRKIKRAGVVGLRLTQVTADETSETSKRALDALI